MIIDMHTHIWPEKIAVRTVEKLENVGQVKAYTNGTVEGLQASMERAGVDYSVVLPVVTKPEQYDTVTAFAEEINVRDNLISFGGIHPKDSAYKEHLRNIKEKGLPGVKIHPDYQETFFDDIEYLRIIDYALEQDLIISAHAGIDIGLPNPIHCTPERVLRVYKELKLEDNVDNKLILAHTGGFGCWQQVLDLLAGLKLYFDISYTIPFLSKDLLVQIVKTHGSDRMMFGTDSPWGDQTDTIEAVKALPLTDLEKENLLSNTARMLLSL